MIRRSFRRFINRDVSESCVRRRLVVRDDDVLVVNGYTIDASILQAIVAPGKRLLWTFVLAENGVDIQPVAISEERCIWLLPEDLKRR